RENLDPVLVPFQNSGVDVDRVADGEGKGILPQALLLGQFNEVRHRCVPVFSRAEEYSGGPMPVKACPEAIFSCLRQPGTLNPLPSELPLRRLFDGSAASGPPVPGQTRPDQPGCLPPERLPR